VPADHSFDIVSEVSMMEMENAIVQAQKELAQRYDFKGSMSSIELDKTEKTITLKAEDDYKLKALTDMVQTKCAKRGVSLKALQYGKVESGMIGGSLKQVITIQSGLTSEKAKEICKAIKEMKLKVQPLVEGDKVRVKAVKIDDLQGVIGALKPKNFEVDLQFINYR
jgi:cyclic-di-GMP-binding protein